VSFELPTRQGRSKRPVPAISIGARKRGKAGKLTPYVLFTAESAEMLFGAKCENTSLELTIGSGADAGKIRLSRDLYGRGNVTIRRQSKVTDDLVVESVLIPHDGKTQLRRTEAEIEVYEDSPHSDGQYVPVGVKVKLPWGRQGSMRSRASSLDKEKRTGKKAL